MATGSVGQNFRQNTVGQSISTCLGPQLGTREARCLPAETRDLQRCHHRVAGRMLAFQQSYAAGGPGWQVELFTFEDLASEAHLSPTLCSVRYKPTSSPKEGMRLTTCLEAVRF